MITQVPSSSGAVDIFILTYYRLSYLKTLIEMLYLSTSYKFRLFVINNAKEDTETEEFIFKLEREGLIHKHLTNNTNLPLAAAYSACFNAFKDELNEYIITAPNDIIPPLLKSPDWLTVFVEKFKLDDSIGSINFVGIRQNFDIFNKRSRLLIEKEIIEKGGDILNLFKRLQKIIYGT